MSEERIARLEAAVVTLEENSVMQLKAITDRDEVIKEMAAAITAQATELREVKTELKENPLQKHLDVWNFEMTYHKNNSVTYQGSTWLCKVPSTRDVPGGPEQSWVLTAKRGRDGKDAKHYAVA